MSDSFPSDEEQLRAHFRSWEVRGRGWQLWPYECRLEPPFRAFQGHHVWRKPFVDDARHATFFGDLFGLSRQSAAPSLPTLNEVQPEEPAAQRARSGDELTELHILLPEGFDVPKDAAGQLLLSLRLCSHPISFELIGLPEGVRLQLACRDSDLDLLRTQLEGFAHGAVVYVEDDFLPSAWFDVPQPHLIADLGLSSEFMRPVRGLHSFTSDPLASLVGALGALRTGEFGMVQLLFEAAEEPWAESVLRSVLDNKGAPFDLLGRDLASQARQKLSFPLFACRLRIAVKAESHERRIQLARGLLGALAQYEVPLGNEFIALERDESDADDDPIEDDLLSRTTHRSGMLLNLDELAGIAHLPGSKIQLGLERLTKRTKAAPRALTFEEGVLIGVNEHAGLSSDIYLPLRQRLQHTYVVGGTGTGKSSLLESMILQEIEAGSGLAVVDPHGDLIDGITAAIPKHRLSDVILFDPSDGDYPIGCNILVAHSDVERTLLASDLVGVFRRLNTSWGDQMNSIFANAILAFLESEQGGTLIDLRHFLVDPKFRASFLSTIRDPEIVYYWQHEFPLLKGNPQAPILTRLDAFLRPKLIRNIIGQTRSVLDFRAILDGRKILLCKFAHGAIGEENAYLLGALVVAKIQQLALSRQDVGASERPPFFLFLDEFHHFVTPSITTLLSGVRKYGIGLVLAHQNLSQLSSRNGELTDAVLTNAGSRICFRLGDQDARHLASGFSFFEAADLQQLATGEAIVRVDGADNDFNLRTYPLPETEVNTAARRREQVRQSSRALWATRLEEQSPALPPSPSVVAPLVAAEKPALPEAAETISRAAAAAKVHEERGRNEAALGRGGQQHKYLQSLVGKFGEDRGFRAILEKPVLDGHGAVDVSLERGELRIAVEVAITTPTTHEIGNVTKCLAAGYELVLLVVPEASAKRRLALALDAEDLGESRSRIRCLTVDEVTAVLDEFAAIPTEKTEKVAGYTVSVRYAPPAEQGQEGRFDAIRKAVARSLRRLSKPD